MAQPGRRSAEAAAVLRLAPTRRRPRLIPPAPLTKAEQAIFDLVASENPHLAATDTPLLASYAQAVVKTMKLARKGDAVGDWEKSARVMAMLATKLRVSPQSSTDPQAIGRRRKDDPGGFGILRKPWEGYDDGDIADDN